METRQKKTSYKALYGVLMALALIFLTQISVVSALDWDNVRYYNKANKSMLIKNAFGLGENIAELRLNTPLNNHVPIGYNKVFEFTIKTYGNYTDALRLIEYYHAKNMSTKEVPLDLKYKSVILENVTTTTCLPAKDNFTAPKCNKVTTEVERVVWNNYISKNMIKGEITLAGFTNVKPGDYIEFIPTWFGERMYEFASWTADLNLGLVAYWDYDVGNVETTTGGMSTSNNSGNVLSNATDYMLGKSGQFDGATWFTVTNNLFDYSANDESSICFWIWYDESAGDAASQRIFSSDEATKNWDLQTQTGDNSMYFGGNMCGHLQTDPNALTDHTWDHFCATCNTTTGRWYKNGVLIKEGTGSYTIPSGDTLRVGCQGGSCSREFGGNLDEVGIWNRTITPQEAILLYNSDVGMTYDPTPTGDGSPNVNLSYPGDNFKSNVPDITFNYSCSDDSNVTNVTLYIDDVANLTTIWGTSNNTGDILTPLYLGDGAYNWTVKCYDNATQLFEGTTYDFAVDTINPDLEMTAPTDGQVFFTPTIPYNVTSNATISDVNLNLCIFYNGTANTTITCGTNTSVLLGGGNHTLGWFASDDMGNFNYTESNITINYYYHNATYTNYAVEAETYDFNLTVTTSDIGEFNGTFYYNGTEYNTTYSDNGTTGYLGTRLQTNLVGTVPFNFTYYLNGTFINANYTHKVNQVQNLSVVSGGSCPAGLSAAINYDFKDEQNDSVLNTTVDYIFRYGISDPNLKTTAGSLETTEFTLCINSTIWNNYSLGYGEVQYQSTPYSDRRYYTFSNERLSNITINNTLYSLPAASSTSFLFTTQRGDLSVFSDMYLTLNRWYPDEDTYKVVEMSRTDDEGQTVMKVEIEDVDYRVGVYYQNGTLVYLAAPFRLVCIATPCSYSLIVPEDAGNSFENWKNLQVSLDFNETTSVFTMVYNDPSQATDTIGLNVYRDTGMSELLICTDNATSYTGVLTCNVTGYSGLLRAIGYRTASPETSVISKSVSAGGTSLGKTPSLFLTFLMMLFLVSVGVVSPILTVIFSVIAFIPALMFGAMPLSILLVLAAMGFIVVHFMKRSAGR